MRGDPKKSAHWIVNNVRRVREVDRIRLGATVMRWSTKYTHPVHVAGPIRPQSASLVNQNASISSRE